MIKIQELISVNSFPITEPKRQIHITIDQDNTVVVNIDMAE